MDKDIKRDFYKLVSRFNGVKYISKKNIIRQQNIDEDLIEQALAKGVIEIDHIDEIDTYYKLGSLGKQLL